MPKLHEVDQGSDAWDRLRMGRPTASQFDKIITGEGKPSKQWKKLAFHCIAERVLDRPVDTYTSPAMERGKELEQFAVDDYELQTGNETNIIGFISSDDGKCGCSPDRLVGEDGLLEAKCPMPQTQIEYLLTGEVSRDYWPQLQGQLYVSERKFVDIIAYHPELPRSIIRVERDDAYIAALDALMFDFNTFILEVMHKISQMQTLTRKALSNVAQELQY